MDSKTILEESPKQEELDQIVKPVKTASHLVTETNPKQPQQSSGLNTPNNETSSQNDTVDLESYLNTSGLSIDSTDLLNSVQDVFSKSGNGLFGQNNSDFSADKDEHLEFHHSKSSQYVVSGYSGSVINTSPHNSQDLLLDGILKTVAFKEQKNNISTDANTNKLNSKCLEISELQKEIDKPNLNLCTSTPVQIRAHKILSNNTENFLKNKSEEFVLEKNSRAEIASFQKSTEDDEKIDLLSTKNTKTDHLTCTSHSPVVIFHGSPPVATANTSKFTNTGHIDKAETEQSCINKIKHNLNITTNTLLSKSSTKQTSNTVEAAISLLSLQNLQPQSTKFEIASAKTTMSLPANRDKTIFKNTTTGSQAVKSVAQKLNSQDSMVKFQVVTMSPDQEVTKVTTDSSTSTLGSSSQYKVLTKPTFKDSVVKVVKTPMNVNVKGKQQHLLKLPLVTQTKNKILTFPGIKLCQSGNGSKNRKIIKVEYQANQVTPNNILKIPSTSKNNFCAPIGKSNKMLTSNNFKINVIKTEKKNFVPFGSVPPKKPIDMQNNSNSITVGGQIKCFKKQLSLPVINSMPINNVMTHFPGIVTASNKLISIGNKITKIKEKPSKSIGTFTVGAPAVVHNQKATGTSLPGNSIKGLNFKIKKEPGTYTNLKTDQNTHFNYGWSGKHIKEEFYPMSSKPPPFKDAFNELTNLDWLFENNSKTVNAMLKKCNPDAESKCMEDLKEKIMDQYNNNLFNKFSKVWGRVS